MFDNIFAAIEKWMRELLSGMVESNLSTMFTAVNQQTSEIAAQVGQTPQGWNSSIFSMIRNISDSVVIPIAGIIITLILCYELISMLTERNNLHDVDTWMFFKYFVKMWIAVYLVSHTFDIAMAVFDIGQSVVNSSSGIIRGNTAIDISSLSMQMQAAMATMAIGELVTLALETLVVSWCLKILSVVITVIMYGRMIEIYLYTSLAPIPFATMSNREWGHVGTNYFRGLFALAFQAFLIQSLHRRKRAAYPLMMSSKVALSVARGWVLRKWRRKEWIPPLVLPTTRYIRSKRKTPAWSRRTRAKKRWKDCTASPKAGKRPEKNPPELRKKSRLRKNPAV